MSYSVLSCDTGKRVSDRTYATAEEANHDYHMNEGHTYVDLVYAPLDMVKFANDLLGDTARIAGPLTSGHYIQVGMGLGFYVPEEAFARVQALATATGKVQFLGVTRTGAALLGSREEILAHPDSAGLVAWIVPQVRVELPPVHNGMQPLMDKLKKLLDPEASR